MYVDRNEHGNIIAVYNRPQRDNHEFVHGAKCELTPEGIVSELKKLRDTTWENCTAELSNGAVVQCNSRTRRDIADVLSVMIDNSISEYSGWNAVNGTFTMSVADFKEAQLQGMMIIKRAFDAYNYAMGNNPDTLEIATQDFYTKWAEDIT